MVGFDHVQGGGDGSLFAWIVVKEMSDGGREVPQTMRANAHQWDMTGDGELKDVGDRNKI